VDFSRILQVIKFCEFSSNKGEIFVGFSLKLSNAQNFTNFSSKVEVRLNILRVFLYGYIHIEMFVDFLLTKAP